MRWTTTVDGSAATVRNRMEQRPNAIVAAMRWNQPLKPHCEIQVKVGSWQMMCVRWPAAGSARKVELFL